MPERITASMLYNLVLCPHRVERDLFSDAREQDPPNAFIQMLWERGGEFEQTVLRALEPEPLNLKGLPADDRVRETLTAMRDRVPLILGARLELDDLLGEPDLLRLEGDGYLAGDVKSGRGDEDGDDNASGQLKLHYAVQLGLYTDLLERLGFSAGRRSFIWDIARREVTYDFTTARGPRTPETWWDAYGRVLGVARRIAARTETTTPALSSDCKMCHWMSTCANRAVVAGDLSLVPEVGRSRRDQLARYFPDIHAFAAADLEVVQAAAPDAFKGLGIKQVSRWQARARLQVDPAGQPYAIEGLHLPQAETTLYFDVETDPMLDFCYLHGFWVVERGVERFIEFHTLNASREEERRAFAEAVAFVRSYPNAPIVHYSPYERTTWRGLGHRYADVITADDANAIFTGPRGFDLYHDAVRPKTEWPTRDYSIKSIAKWLGFSWRDKNPSGAASIEWFQGWLRSGDPAELQRILDYNEDDCRAMEVVLEALRTLPVRGG